MRTRWKFLISAIFLTAAHAMSGEFRVASTGLRSGFSTSAEPKRDFRQTEGFLEWRLPLHMFSVAYRF